MTDLPQDRVFLQVPHIMQNEDWDCGLACAKMILNFMYPNVKDGPKDFSDICEKLGIGQSVWTIDLAYLVAQYGVKHQLYTITLGVDPAYQGVNFYTKILKDEFTAEQERVNQRFVDASSKGIKAEKRSISNAEIVGHLSGQNPAIILVDNSILHCEQCKQNSSNQGCGIECLSLSDSSKQDGYEGHFIVLCGLDKTKKQFLYHNPGISDDLCCCSFTNLDEARRSHGTDEDILLVYSS